MIPDEFPENDAVAKRARRALYQLAGSRPMTPAWADVQKAARRVRQKRRSVVGAAGALVLVGASAAVANVDTRDGRPVSVIGSESAPAITSTSATTTPSTPPFSYDSSSAPPRTGEGPISDGVPPDSGSIPDESETTEPRPVQPQDGSWSASMSVDASPIAVGDRVTVNAELRNTGSQPQQTNGYGTLSITCARWLPTVEAAPGWPIGEWVDEAILAPGASRSFSMTFVAKAEQVGDASCTAGIDFMGEPWWAGPFDGLQADSVTIEIVAPSTSSTGATTTTNSVPTTETTIL
jgi:hypothetical protein